MKTEPKVYPYMTVEEMRIRKDLVEDIPKEGGGTRFEGSTIPELALEYFKRDQKILECGSVFGAFTKYMRDQGYKDYHVLDFANMLHFAGKEEVTFHEIDFNTEKMPYPDKSFDGVTAWGVAEHMENPFHFVREVWRVTKPGGVFLFSLPNVHHLSSRLGFLFHGVFPRWNLKSNHITILPNGVIEKTIFRYFELEKTVYTKPGTITTRKPKWPLRRIFDRISEKTFPSNALFGNYVGYVLRRKDKYDPPVYSR
ncbi:hypothetical protein A3B18_02750 [Candidatus Giovannonibacteria bacterium RIFCSPLOWO2_01_FULL_46_13]|uniref:Methyltransferase type 11 domain-containing protein n=1 Tax=Candidatus Giovannonibacteria bacterium RIFCSPLOWO2_01_FULL_46_13 TaxID=1798352 RepID=A0A1F5X303_9BACT|nr:MAG: hypothetical protein A3B18_02750 [Candidatus Giovannonibacteria bacterium RIFCSPLOWO2_01_FULL_46_13]